jgi:drug/metabolite transporter (DMT)-like permease
LSWGGLFFLLLALCGITFGTIYQKKKCSMIDYRTLAAGQNLMGLVPMFILAYTFEPFRVQWTWQFNFALFWMVVFISLIAFIILHNLIKRGEVTRVASLFYMMTPCTAVMDYFVFGNKLDETTWVSLIIISIGIYLVNQQSPKRLLEAEEAQV